MKTEKLEQKKEIEKLTAKIKLMKQLTTKEGFFNYYFELLKNSKSKEQAFNIVNDLYCKLFGVNRFCSFLEFSKMIKA